MGATIEGKAEESNGNGCLTAVLGLSTFWIEGLLLLLCNHNIALRGFAGGAPRARTLSIVPDQPLNVQKRRDGRGCDFEDALDSEKVNIVKNPQKIL